MVYCVWLIWNKEGFNRLGHLFEMKMKSIQKIIFEEIEKIKKENT